MWEEFGTKESFDSLKAHRTRIGDDWQRRLRKTGFKPDTLAAVLEQAGAAGVVSSLWSSGWGVYRVFGTTNEKVPVVALSLEDYNLLFRLVEYGDNPIVRVEVESKLTGVSPTFNTIGTIRGTEKPDEFVVLSAHLDSWEAGSGATDNGTGTIIMMETMRILKKYYPNPKRTIIVGHWCSEEEGLNGSRAFVKDHPEMLDKIQAVFNQDNGTGRITNIGASGFLNAGEHLARWLSRTPDNITRGVAVSIPGMPGGGGTDHASFVAAGGPLFGLGSNAWTTLPTRGIPIVTHTTNLFLMTCRPTLSLLRVLSIRHVKTRRLSHAIGVCCRTIVGPANRWYGPSNMTASEPVRLRNNVPRFREHECPTRPAGHSSFDRGKF